MISKISFVLTRKDQILSTEVVDWWFLHYPHSPLHAFTPHELLHTLQGRETPQAILQEDDAESERNLESWRNKCRGMEQTFKKTHL